MFVWHRQGIFSKWRTVLVFFPSKDNFKQSLSEFRPRLINFLHVFLLLYIHLWIWGNIHTCTADPHTPVQHLDWPLPTPPPLQTLTTFPILPPHCTKVSNAGRCGYLWLQTGCCLFSHEAEHVSRWCFCWKRVEVVGVGWGGERGGGITVNKLCAEGNIWP